ncbi:ParA family protein [Thiolapillus sp.]|uniref:ParA family protein n=1 Tax=Thiolapillus sp. TaxID=2017437 RepID=UPI0025F1A486|nr:ParA family protein [Thiolapillus sp.]
MKILTIANNKGGVGKTFLVKLLAEYAVMIRGWRVLLLDFDPQTNLSRRYLDMDVVSDGGPDDFVPPPHPDADETTRHYSVANIWDLEDVLPYETAFENLDIIPAHANRLQEIEYRPPHDLNHSVVLAKFFEAFKDDDLYDLVIIDTRPSKGRLNTAALHVSTHVVIPTELEAPSVEGLVGMIGLVNRVRDVRTGDCPLSVCGVLANKAQMNTVIHKEHWEMLNSLEGVGEYIVEPPLPHRVVYKESMLYGQPSIWVNGGKSEEAQAALPAVERVMSCVMGGS